MKIVHVGINNEYTTISACLNSINEPTYIILDDEHYFEKIIINKENIIIDGLNKATIEFNDYAKKIHSDGREYITFRTYTVLVKAKNVQLKNLTIINSAGEGENIGQAVALHLYNDNILVEHCKLIAHQDTLFCGPFSPDLIDRYIDLLPSDERIHKGEFHQYFINCYIAGTVDFIFGGASADFINCTIETLKTNRTCYVAAPDHNKENEHGFNFINCKIKSEDKNVKENTFLARPWREYGLCRFINCYLGENIKKEGFSIWEGTNRHINSRFYEINSIGPGSKDNKINRPNWIKIVI